MGRQQEQKQGQGQKQGYLPFHQKYRPQHFGEIVGQGAAVQALCNAIEQGRIAPAYLFEGVRGTGKTSCARILARSLNCLAFEGPTLQPCGICESCRSIATGTAVDVIEIDAASNTGVDNIRELIERTHLVPLLGRYKVYVIDEVHKLSSSAMNALLKTLEEPPEKVVFILATTEVNKVLPTIISRCQRYRFGAIGVEEIVQHLGWIAQAEGIEIEQAALERIAQASGGGLRDAESLLDQVSLLPQPVGVEAVDWITGAVPEQAVLEMLRLLLEPDSGVDSDPTIGVVEQAQALLAGGKSALVILEALTAMVQLLLRAKYAGDAPHYQFVQPETWQALLRLAEAAEVPLLRQMQSLLRTGEGQIRQAHNPPLWLYSLLLELAGLTAPVNEED